MSSLPDINHPFSGEATPLSRFLAHDFANDDEYQQGVAGILTSGVLEGKTDEEKGDILLRSEVFYFNRLAGSSITVEEARSARAARTATAPSQTPTQASLVEEEPQTLTFAQLKMLIEQGRTDEIPNNKIIPNVLSSEAPSESKAEVRKKPWETTAAA
ncbi:hypothetical protein L226DRAFT_540024 [Lentinus tigrinus ALCF2SS1-7]|uniref:Uncharacterized protein n=1 Tax=Lentinus tigrinus ALCF2SS1-6 TaxID=1328759 RepID=A0A5C2RRG3_9APHY|nr:hypothetical protein L227DRAFT_580696 [Lentinus tigrinus ALCF2SS1-6]RPD69175.1 hypothetical protein L226DRAFT_540024 [Lentinus tigrinus ALCF2SS1-7]